MRYRGHIQSILWNRPDTSTVCCDIDRETHQNTLFRIGQDTLCALSVAVTE